MLPALTTRSAEHQTSIHHNPYMPATHAPPHSFTPYDNSSSYPANQVSPVSLDPTKRCIYLGHLEDNTEPREILNIIRGGPIESLNIIPEKKCAFVNFIHPGDALSFYNRAMQAQGGVYIGTRSIKVGWGKSAVVTADLMTAVQGGVTRNVFIGRIEEETSVEELKVQMTKYGEVEKVDVLPKKKIAFIHFLDISSAVKCVQALRTSEERSPGKTINYGPDRCASQPTRFDFTPTNPDTDKTPFQTQDTRIQHSSELKEGELPSPTVWVSTLNVNVKQEEIEEIFEPFGEIKQSRLFPKSKSAFITFLQTEQALRALDSLQGEELKGTAMTLHVPKATRHLWIGNVGEDVTDTLLTNTFAKYGSVESVKILRKGKCGFVNFVDEKMALDACRALNGTVLGQEKLAINFQWPSKKKTSWMADNSYNQASGMEWGYGGWGENDWQGDAWAQYNMMAQSNQSAQYGMTIKHDQASLVHAASEKKYTPHSGWYKPEPELNSQSHHIEQTDYGRSVKGVKNNDNKPDSMLIASIRYCSLCKIRMKTKAEFIDHYLGMYHNAKAEDKTRSGKINFPSMEEHRSVMKALGWPKAQLDALLDQEFDSKKDLGQATPAWQQLPTTHMRS